MRQERLQDVVILLALLGLSLLFFWPVTVGGKTLLPADNVFAWEPWRSYAAEAGVGIPHNGLLSDLYLENYVWKRFIVQSLRARQLPLWNPYIFAGVPFLAAGQHSALYPPSVLFYLLPLPAAYGWFAALHLFLAGAFTYLLGRTLKLGRPASAFAAVTFMFCGFMVTHNVFPMIVAAAVWLPLLLTLIERIVRRAEEGGPLIGQIPWAVMGALALGMVCLAGHPEMYYYVALICAAFALWRLGGLAWRQRRWSTTARTALVLALMAILGIGLGSAQWLPLLELVRQNFRTGSATLREILGWAYSPRRIISLFLPNFFGNPTQHSYFDLFSWQRVPVTHNALGEPSDTIYWGIKNYVEGASYLGLLPTLLALVALARWRGRHIGFFGLTALVSILFVFGAPLYAVVYHLPGLNQVHSPFRWIYPYSLSMALLAGMGLEVLGARGPGPTQRWPKMARWLTERLLPPLVAGGGAALLAMLALSLMLKERVAALAEGVLHSLALAPQAFADGRMFFSYQFGNLLFFALMALLAGLALALRPRFRRAAGWGGVVVLLTLGELFFYGQGFFPANDPKLVGYRTPAIAWLQSDAELFRLTSYVGGSEKTFNANAGMIYDLADVRGYDSIIPRQYVAYMSLIQEQVELPYNRIAPIIETHPEALDSPLLDLLNVKYVLTDRARAIARPGYTLVYEGEVRIYRNDDYLPRAFLVPRAVVIPDGAEREAALRRLNPREVVILEEPPAQPQGAEGQDVSGQVEAIHYTANEVLLTVQASAPCFLVLADSYFPGWLAFIRPPEAADPARAEQSLPIYRADGNFRAVQVPAGRHVVRFKYSPNSVKYGLYLSFLTGITLVLALAAWAWARLYRGGEEEEPAKRVTKNTLAPIGLSLLNKIIDMAFAMLMLRILGPADAGAYYLAINIIGWFDIITNFGLNALLTREIAKDRSQANRYLTNATLLRLGLCLASVPILAIFFLVRRWTAPLEPRTILAIALFGVALLPSNISAGLSAIFTAYERMEIPAGITTLTTLLKVSLGTLALVLGTGYLGLAGVSIVVNLITMGILYGVLRATLFQPRLELDWSAQKRMLQDSYPLMVNNLLATLFFKVAVLLLEWILKDLTIVGWYSTAYKYIDAVGVIPAYFTIALFPLMSRYAAEAKGSLYKAYLLALKLLLMVAVPGAWLGWALSKELITLLGGVQYLPYAAQILKVMIWYMPIGFINSVTQYVLIALDQQRFLTRAFAIGLAFNVIANVALINRFGFMAAAYVAVASELVLLIPFYVGVRRHLARIPWLELAGKQALCALPLGALLVFLPHRQSLLFIPVGLACYGLGMRVWGVLSAEEREVVGRVLPLQRFQAKLAALWARRVD